MTLAGSLRLLAVGRTPPPAPRVRHDLFADAALTIGMTCASTALPEPAHRATIYPRSVVRVFTIIDVIDSSALQARPSVGACS